MQRHWAVQDKYRCWDGDSLKPKVRHRLGQTKRARSRGVLLCRCLRRTGELYKSFSQRVGMIIFMF